VIRKNITFFLVYKLYSKSSFLLEIRSLFMTLNFNVYILNKITSEADAIENERG
jgi:hypothetical protein